MTKVNKVEFKDLRGDVIKYDPETDSTIKRIEINVEGIIEVERDKVVEYIKAAEWKAYGKKERLGFV
ncbi:hypothetical protein BEH94_09640 [Candidatus Altiarchaeales archaeon WOR_SM1_SCG]|nr:hypothetical protein BEH94_09640 [Candidatus Altiarchaeales archaeon WOR_SM1_SCG]